MKQLVTAVLLSLTLNASAQSQVAAYQPIDLHLDMLNTQTKSYSYRDESSIPLPVGMMLGGATFITAGLLTVPDYSVGPNGETQTKPFFRQGARMMAIMTGAGVFTAGVVISIAR